MSPFHCAPIFGVAVALLGACTRPDVHPPREPATPTAVQSDLVNERTFAVMYRAPGTVRGRSTATLVSRGVGHVRAIHVRAGDLVRKGQVLAELEANEVRASSSRARAMLASTLAGKVEAENAVVVAESAAELARTTHDRASRLLEQNAIPRAQFDEAQASLRSATAAERMTRARLQAVESSIDEARAALAETRAMFEYTKIIAPFDGRVLDRLVDQGALATPGTPLLVVADDARPRVEAPVPESHAAALALGSTVSLELENAGTVFSGTVAEIVPNVDVAARAFLVKIDLAESRPEQLAALRPGSFARAAFPVASARRLAVPDSALSRFGALDRVFVVENGKARLRMITAGESQGSWTAVLSGLSAGERVVRNPPANLRDASPVQEKP